MMQMANEIDIDEAIKGCKEAIVTLTELKKLNKKLAGLYIRFCGDRGDVDIHELYQDNHSKVR